jgi:phosphogluconate dehydratase
MNPTVNAVTRRIRERSAKTRERISRGRAGHRPAARQRAHGLRQRRARLRGAAGDDKLRVVAERAPNIGIVTAYNDMLSAHQPYERFPR